MGVFTIYCCVCSGPAMDVTAWAREKQREEDEEDKLYGWEAFIASEGGAWLNQISVLSEHTATGMVRGKCDSYGRVITLTEGEFNVCPINNDDSPKHGVLLHYACWQMLMARLNGIDPEEVPKKEKELIVTNLHVYHFLKKRVDECGCAAGFDYGPEIGPNCGQDYNLVDHQAWLVTQPIMNQLASTELPQAPAPSDTASFGTLRSLPLEVRHMVFTHLTVRDLLAAQRVSKGFLYVATAPAVWVAQARALGIEAPASAERAKWHVIGQINTHVRNTVRITSVLDQIEKAFKADSPMLSNSAPKKRRDAPPKRAKRAANKKSRAKSASDSE